MTSMLINRRDLDFMLYELLDVEALTARPRFAEHGRETFAAALDTAHEIAEKQFAPHNAKADANEPTFDGETVSLIPEVGEAVRAFASAGLMAAHQDFDLGGMQLPWVVTQACMAMFQSANVSTAAYPFLTMAAANMLQAHGSQEQVGLFLRPMLEGRFLGTMCLSEPQAGSSLADIRTKATPTAEGHHLLSGNKMWISGGDNELTENIVHMVLARIDGAPPGVKGISLFIVPKFLVDADGSLRARNDVRLAGLNHKMGYRGTVNTVLNFGENGDCIGYLMGEPHQGLAQMFHMMNEARIGVGLGATMLGYAGYLYSLDYARNRPQGRPLAAKDLTAAPVPIVEHTDVRRMLLAQKAYCEGALALCLSAAQMIDDQHTAPDTETRRRAGLLLDVLTPVVKAWPSEWCLEANKLAIQILGGYGYTRDYPVEQLYRDNRLNMIHEGTNGIQALDLLGRKAGMAGGEGLTLLLAEMRASAGEAADVDGLAAHATALSAAADRLETTTATLLAAAAEDPERSLANAHVYLEMAGTIVIAWTWLRQALVAARRRDGAHDDDRAFYAGKIRACDYFFRFELPKTEAQARLLSDLDDTTLAMKDAWF